MGLFEKLKNGLKNTKDALASKITGVINSFTKIDEDFFEELEETLILSDIGAVTSANICEALRKEVKATGTTDPAEVKGLLKKIIAGILEGENELILDTKPTVILVIGVNGAGKTTTIGKLAYNLKSSGKKVVVAAADTFRAAAIEQLEVWAKRADVTIVSRERGSDPASVCYETIERAEKDGSDMVLIDTAGRLHTSDDLMRELQKVVNVVRKRSNVPVYTVLVIDATTGQNGLQQAQKFNDALDLDGVIVTKLDGTAKGGIALAVSHELELPIFKIGVGEGIDDLQDFDAHDFARALIGDMADVR